MRRERTSRRALLRAGAGLAGALAVPLAGCVSFADDAPQDQSYEQLHLTAVYLAEGVDLSLPDGVPTVGAATNADLLVYPGDADVDAERAVEWLADGHAGHLLGARAGEQDEREVGVLLADGREEPEASVRGMS